MQKKVSILKKIFSSKFISQKRRSFEASILMLFSFGLFSNAAFAQFPTLENFNSGIPATWLIDSNPVVTNNWAPTTATGGYLSTPGAVVNPSLNNTVGTTAEYFLITPQFTTPQVTEVRFFTKQGSFVNRGTTFELRLSTAAQPTLASFNVLLQSWTEANLNVSATTWEEKIVTLPDLPAGVPVHIAFVAVTNQVAGNSNTVGDSWFVDNIRVIESCAKVTGINSTMSANSALINWTHPTATNFEIQIVADNAGIAASGTPVSGTTFNTTTLTNGNPLVDGTNYDVYIKTVCDASTASLWAGPFNIQTSILGLNCGSPVVIPSNVSTTPYVLNSNLANYFSATDYTAYTTIGSNCFPNSTSNQLSGNHLFFSYTPTTTGLINIKQTVTNVSGGGTNACYNASSSITVFNGCANVGVSCMASTLTQTSGANYGTWVGQIDDFYVVGGQTYIIVMSSPYPYSSNASICFNFVVSGATCPAPSPSGSTYNNLTQTSANFSWANVGNLVSEWQYVALPVSAGAPTGSTTLLNTLTNTNNPSGVLTPATDYNLYVRSVCGGTPGPWAAPLAFRTPCNIVPLPYYAPFNEATLNDACWSQINLNNDADFFSIGGTALGGPNGTVAKLRVSNALNNTNDILISPTFHLDGVTQKRLRFKYNNYGNWGSSANNPIGGPCSFEIKMSTTGIGAQSFTTTIVPLAQYSTGYNFVEMTVPLPNITGDINLAWILPAGAQQTGVQFYLDDVYVEDLPACSEPSYPVVTPGSITTNSVNVSWTNGYNNTQWQLVAQPLGSGVPTGTFVPGAVVNIVNTNPYTITGLNPSTQYEFYMRAYCNAVDQSIWVGPINFNTLCIAQNLPYYESLDNTDPTTKKFCWSTNNANGDVAKWTIDATEARIWPQPTNMFTPFSSYDDWLITVPVNAVGVKRLRFDYRVVTSPFFPTPRGNFEVLMSSTPNFSTYTVLIPSHDFTNNDYAQDTVLFTGTGTTYIAFRLPPNMQNPSDTGIVMIDNVIIDDAPPCPNPIALTASNIAQTTATLSWTAGYAETQWQIVVQENGTGIPTGSGTTVNGTPTYNVTNLLPDTAYEYYVRAICATDNSTWVGPFKFRTTCNAIPTPFIETFDSNTTTETCWTIVNANGDGNDWNLNQTVNPIGGDQMAALFTGMNGANNDWLISPTLSAHAGQRLRFFYKTYSSDFEEDLKVMLSVNGVATNQFNTILYENNKVIPTDATGTVAGTNTITMTSTNGVLIGDRVDIPGWVIPYASTVTAINGNTITISANAVVTAAGPLNVTFVHEVINNTTVREKVINLTGITGNTNINIGFHTPFFPPNPWNYRGQFTFIDNVIVEDIPACPSVINVSSTNIIDTSVQVNWESTGSETSWEISLQPFGTPAPVGNTLPAYLYTTTTHPFTINGLTPATKYHYYVRAICSGTSQSTWVGPFEFTTRCDFANVCEYTISTISGNTGQVTQSVNVMQNGVVVQELEFPGFGQTIIDYPVFLCSGVEFNLYWDGMGSGLQYSQAQIIVKDQTGTVVWTSPLGLGTVNTNIYTGFASCGTITCPTPTNLTVSNQGVLSWTPGGSETQWEVFIQPLNNGTLPQSGQIVNSPTYTPVATDFVNGTAGTYEYFVRAICSNTNKSYWFGPKTFIRNDEASTALRLIPNTGSNCQVSGVDATFIGATPSTTPTSCSGVNGGDIWYDFVATSRVHIIELSDFAPGSYYDSSYEGPWPKIIMSLYEVQTDGSLVEKGCSDNNSFVTTYSNELVVGKTYKIRLKLNDVITNNKTFHICITTPTDLCDMDAFNYDFEKLPMQFVTGVSTIIDDAVVPGWKTNTDWGTMFFHEGSNSTGGLSPYSGGQCIQLVQDNTSLWNPSDPNIKGLYKDFDTSEIIKMDYSFASATRSNGTTVELWAGPVNGPFTLVTEDFANSTNWDFIQGTYNVPTGQNTTRFIFRTRGYAIGHLLDAANFKANTDVLTADTTLDCTQSSMNVEAIGVGQWVAGASNPSVATIVNPTSMTTAINGIDTPGVYTFIWKTRYCEKPVTITRLGVTEVPTVVSPVTYCTSQTATALTATAPSGYTLIWYTVPVNGTGDVNAPVPSTTTAGTTTYYVALVNGLGCVGPRVPIDVIVNQLITPEVQFAYDNTVYCANGANPVLVPANGFTSGGTFSATPSGLSINASTGAINLLGSAVGNYVINYNLPANGCVDSGSSSTNISIVNEATFAIENVCENQMMILNVVPTNGSDLSNVDYTWQDDNGGFIGNNTSQFNVSEYLTQNPTLTFPLTFTVIVDSEGCLNSEQITIDGNSCGMIPKGISPNGDGDNDTFDLTGLGVKELTIVNRYGMKVFSFSGNYTNQFAGSTNDGKHLPDGTYFYSIRFENGKAVTGWVYVIRQY
ncbi:choice-of-anchor J domain-containing protein [Flavobacterium urocaniciphilum]|uniref:Gliding motility-associated C-terminal domain-containing protein n=1 Tax=Flavobacterium urocaniciphilum TaxID=1299341 RepID=A0A1H9CP52_9FLAO|nr:choice-of-anchor J domain-containing protein [Flavobacterium urocaniciphilum]SEQ02985.1 gliding motility-associated C-terminal domain-containing protein [Flavobacterium urocaniciphilum]